MRDIYEILMLCFLLQVRLPQLLREQTGLDTSRQSTCSVNVCVYESVNGVSCLLCMSRPCPLIDLVRVQKKTIFVLCFMCVTVISFFT